LRVGFKHDSSELLRCGEPPQRLHVELISLIRGDRGLIEDARRDLNILRAQGSKDFAGVQAMSRDFIRIEPDPHRVFARPLELDIADARQSRQHVLYVQRRVVRQIQRVTRAVRRIEVDRQEDVGRRLPHLHAQALDVFGQPRQGVLDPVLRQHLCDIKVGPDSKRHRNRELAVTGRLAAQVQHVFDAVDFLLKRRRDGP
jgi:hypothetical protein